jgi:hypothetical protein
MSEKQLTEALSAIHDEAEKLLKHEMPEEVKKGLELIISISRYQTDVRSSKEKSS